MEEKLIPMIIKRLDSLEKIENVIEQMKPVATFMSNPVIIDNFLCLKMVI